MRIIHGKGYSDADRLQFKNLVFKNIHTAIKILIMAMEMLGLKYEDNSIEDALEELVMENTDTLEEIPDHHQKLIARLWADPAVQKCYERRREYQLSDSAK